MPRGRQGFAERHRGALLLLLLAACGGVGPGEDGAETASVRTVSGPIIARVDGEPIGLEEVREVVAGTGLSARVALDRMIAEHLLGRYAAAQGYGETAEVDRELTRARARALLESTIEREVTPETIGDAEIAARFAAIKKTLDRREERWITRIRFRRKPAGLEPVARRLAESVLEKMRAAGTVEGALSVLNSFPEGGSLEGVRFGRERVALRAGSKAAGPEISAAVSALSGPQVVPAVIESSNRFEVAVLESITPPAEAVLADHADEIREQLVIEHRARALTALLDELRRKASVQYDEKAIAGSLADETLMGNLP